MKHLRSRVAVVFAGSALLASGLSVAAIAASPAAPAAAAASGAASSPSYNPNVTLTDP